MLLTLPSSLLVWTRVYYYAIVMVGSSLALFASPAKGYIVKELKRYQGAGKPALHRTASTDGVPVLGMPDDPAQAIDDAVREIREEVEMRRRKGSIVKMPEGRELQGAIEERLGKKLS
jgi:lysophospholipid acyltransferase